MTKETILHILAFMKRAQLSGEEVPAYNEGVKQLNEEYVKLDLPKPTKKIQK